MPFFFFQILIFRVSSLVKGEKNGLKWQKICLSHSIYQQAYIIWLWFLVHKCKMMKSSDAFFIFSKLWFSGLLGGEGVKGHKMDQNDKKFSHSVSQEPYLIWVCFLVDMCKMVVSPALFFIFSKYWFFWFLEGARWWVKGQKMYHNYQLQSATL